MNTETKLEKLKDTIKSCESVAVAFSGGVDSTFLLKVSHDVLGAQVAAITARSSTYPERELREAIDFAGEINVAHIIIDSDELLIDGFSDNPVNRCYLCKRELFSKMMEVAQQNGLKRVVEGSNTDDLNDYRPGMRAIQELGILSPLKEAGLSKEDIRKLSRDMELPTWDKPAFACLSSRFPYGHKITREKLRAVEHAEQFLMDQGFRQVRVRHHGDIARIEVLENERCRFFDIGLIDEVCKEFYKLGFAYVTLDLKGYRTGSMNEVIGRKIIV